MTPRFNIRSLGGLLTNMSTQLHKGRGIVHARC